jgi:hypothetical protein
MTTDVSCIYLFQEVSVQIFFPFLIGLFVFLLSFKSSLCILDLHPLLDMGCTSIFFPFTVYLTEGAS